jgi:ABC-type uncharacterized transport system auxiliary subunit
MTAPRYAPTLRYSLNANVETSQVASCGKTLGVRPLDYARPYKQKIVYRDPGNIVGEYTNEEWAELPRDFVTRAVTDALSSTGRFSDVGNASDITAPDYVLTGYIRKFDENRTGPAWTADCEVRLELRQQPDGNAVWGATLSASEKLAANDPTALADAMSKAVSKVIADASKGIAACKLVP